MEIGEQGNASTLGSFEHFAKVHSFWGVEAEQKSWVVFRDHPLLKDLDCFVERVQTSKELSFMHAAIVLQHYLVCMGSSKSAGMLSTSGFWKQKMSERALQNYIFENAGGNSTVFLRDLLGFANSSCFEMRHCESSDILSACKNGVPPWFRAATFIKIFLIAQRLPSLG